MLIVGAGAPNGSTKRQDGLVAYRAPHTLSAEDVPVNAGAGFAAKATPTS